MTRPSAIPFFAITLLVWATPALRAQEQNPEHWRIQAELGFNGASGNSSFTVLRTGFKATHLRTDEAEFEVSALVRYGKNDEKVIANDAKASVKFDLWPQDRFSPFLFADAGRDRIRRLDGRLSGGAGVKWTFWEVEGGEASLSGAALYDYQNYAVVSETTGTDVESVARWSLRTKLEKKLSEGATFEHVAFWQPTWDEAADYVLDVTNSISTRVLANLSLALEHQYLRDASPPAGVGRDDQRYSVLLKLTF